MNPKILIFGAYGFLGSYLCDYLKDTYKIYKIGRNPNSQIQVKRFNQRDIQKIIKLIKPKIIINLIGETNVDLCEKKKKHCLKVNFEIVKNIVNSVIKLKYNIFFLQISSDQVYSGKGPHDEKKIKPLNQYSLSKKYSEKWSSKINSCILRTNFFGFSKDKNKVTFTDWIYRSLKKKKKINAYKNIFFSPLYVKTLCKYLKFILKQKITGIYNLGSKDYISKAEYIHFIAKKYKFDIKLIDTINYEKKNLAMRPLDMRMNSMKISKKLKLKLPTVKNEITKMLKNRKNYK